MRECVCVSLYYDCCQVMEVGTFPVKAGHACHRLWCGLWCVCMCSVCVFVFLSHQYDTLSLTLPQCSAPCASHQPNDIRVPPFPFSILLSHHHSIRPTSNGLSNSERLSVPVTSSGMTHPVSDSGPRPRPRPPDPRLRSPKIGRAHV